MEHRLLSEKLSTERLDGEVIAIDFVTGRYFSFEGPGADVIHLLSNSVPRAQWREIFVESYEMVPDKNKWEREIDSFLQELNKNSLIAPVSSLTTSSTGLPNDVVREVWTSPTFMVNDELVDLLVIDPIHESGDRGWPQGQS